MQFSAHNIVSKLRDSEEWYIVNLLSGNADLVDAAMGQMVREGILPTGDDLLEWVEKGYVVDPKAEEKIYKAKYLDFLDQRENDEVQVFFVPWYSCNFACTYCFQESYALNPVTIKPEVQEAFFDWMRNHLAGRRKYITVFGGEPLMPVPAMRDFIQRFVARATEENYELAFVTNGYNLSDYLDILSQGKIREIQVTLDGSQEIHDQRRVMKGGAGTFEKIVQGIDGALALGMKINLRMVVDRQNMESLPELARFAIAKGWTKNKNFITQLGRNYELHTCQEGNEKLFSRVEMFEAIYRLVREYPEILEFHRPAFSISRFLFDEGQLPGPLFDSCTGTKTEWALDGSGRIYACTATVGKPGEELGTYWPEVTENRPVLEQWESRDVCSISECSTCNVRLACGGGCTSVAKNQFGKIHSPDCRPVQQLLEMGVSLYNSQN